MTSLDLLGGIVLTAAAAITLAALAASYPAPPRTRWRVTSGFAAWFALLVTLCALDVFHPVRGLGVAGLGLALLIPVATALLVVRARPERKSAVLAMAPPVLIGIHAVRVIGAFFILLESAGRLSAPFAPTAGWGDVFISITALPVAWAVSREVPSWRALALVWNVLGALDLVVAVSLGVMSAPDSPLHLFEAPRDGAILTTLPWMIIPGFLVPILFMVHLQIFAQLARGDGRQRFRPRSATARQITL